MLGNDLIVRQQDLVENPSARVAICLVLDTSWSMNGLPIQELNEGVDLFFKAILNDDVARYSAEISVVTFGGSVETALDFMSIERQVRPSLSASGDTPMGAAIVAALNLLQARKEEYGRAGVDYYQPWMVLMTDGAPTDDISLAAAKISDLVSARKLTVFPIGIGNQADMATLKRLSPTRPPLRLKGLNFPEFFEWLSKSVSKVSQSTPGEDVPLDVSGIAAWGSV